MYAVEGERIESGAGALLCIGASCALPWADFEGDGALRLKWQIRKREANRQPMDRPVSAVRNTCFAILSAAEYDLREMIGDAALRAGDTQILPEDVRQVTSLRFAQDNKQRPDLVPENDLDLIAYTDFADLAKMLYRRAKALSEEFGCDIEILAGKIERMVRPRNRVCHSRPLEEDDLPNFLDFAKLLLREYKNLPWTELRSVEDVRRNDPSYVLRLEIPSFWRVGTERCHHNLPLPDFEETSFLGRVNERRDLRKHLLGAHPIVSIVGEGGVGKSALAVQSCYELLDIPEGRGFDAVVWVSLRTKVLTPGGVQNIRDRVTGTLGVVRTAVEALGPHALTEREDVETLTTELIDYMEHFRVLLVIDNFESLAADALRPLLTAVPVGSKILITSRVGLGELEIRYKLEALDNKTAISLLRRFSRCLNLELLSTASEGRLEDTAPLFTGTRS